MFGLVLPTPWSTVLSHFCNTSCFLLWRISGLRMTRLPRWFWLCHALSILMFQLGRALMSTIPLSSGSDYAVLALGTGSYYCGPPRFAMEGAARYVVT